MQKTILAFAVILAFVSGSTSAAFADDISISFAAVVDMIYDPHMYIPSHLIQVGDTLRGHYTYDSNTIDSDPSPYVGEYYHTTSPYGIMVRSNGLVFETDPDSVDFVIVIEDSSTSGGLHDEYRIYSWSNLQEFGLPVHLILVNLRDNTATALSSDALPTSAPVLSDWPDDKRLSIFGVGFYYEIQAHFISMSLGGIPTVSQWSLLILVVFLLAIGAYLIYTFKGRASS